MELAVPLIIALVLVFIALKVLAGLAKAVVLVVLAATAAWFVFGTGGMA